MVDEPGKFAHQPPRGSPASLSSVGTDTGRSRFESRSHGPPADGDQAAAALSVLTDSRRVSVINAPAGVGKTRVLAEVARAWAAAGLGPVDITASQSARTGILASLPVPAWSAQVPETGDPERQAYLAQVAELMDARKERIGAPSAAAALLWAAGPLGPVPGDPAARLEWQRRASSIGAYRELSGHDDPADPIGPEPAASSPDLRAAWHEALAALGPVDGPDVRGMTDGLLLRLRDSYPVETAWATAMEDRTDWERATRQQRQLAVAADAELRRHPASAGTRCAPPNRNPSAKTARRPRT